MATQLKYASTQSISVKPTIVEISLYLLNYGKTPKEAHDLLLDGRNKIKELVSSLGSYRENSYKQQNVGVEKLYKYEKKNDGCNITSEKVFDKYAAHTYITLILERNEENDDIIIEDFTNIFNLALNLDYRCTYHHNITETERESYNRKLYASCINNGLDEITAIIDDTKLRNKDIELNEVLEDKLGSYPMMRICSENNYNEETDVIINPELIKELFNNNIVIEKTLTLRISLI